MVTLLHLSDIHMGSGFCHGRINPDTGLNTRLEDFVAALSRCIDRAIAEPADLVLFGGDAFPDATPAPQIQQAFAAQFRRLADAEIPTVLLVGNHDQHAQGRGGASLSIYRTLGVPGVVVGDRLQTHWIETRNGPVQVITLPWLTPSTLLTQPETEGLSTAEVNQRLIDRLRVALEGEIRQLKPDYPAILLAHAMVDTARYGAERFLAVGKGFTVPMAMLARSCFDYVALGHVHRHQILCEQPPVVYPGSIERVDFSEANETKGYIWADVRVGEATVEFCPLPTRPFKTISVDISNTEKPQEALLKAIAEAHIEAAVVRLSYTLRPDQLDLVNVTALHEALMASHSYALHPSLVSQGARARLPELSERNQHDPISALQTYLANRDDLSELSEEMLAAAVSLLDSEAVPENTVARPDIQPDDEASQQLRLL